MPLVVEGGHFKQTIPRGCLPTHRLGFSIIPLPSRIFDTWPRSLIRLWMSEVGLAKPGIAALEFRLHWRHLGSGFFINLWLVASQLFAVGELPVALADWGGVGIGRDASGFRTYPSPRCHCP